MFSDVAVGLRVVALPDEGSDRSRNVRLLIRAFFTVCVVDEAVCWEIVWLAVGSPLELCHFYVEFLKQLADSSDRCRPKHHVYLAGRPHQLHL